MPMPDVAAAIAPLLDPVPARARPRLVAELELAAAERYDAWASADASHADGLRDCARREREVARRVKALFALHADDERACGEALAAIAAAYRAAMGDRPVSEQYAIQAAAERTGAAFWRAVAATVPDAGARRALESCAELEEQSAAFLETLAAR